jgi:hypothetical protein
MKAASTFVLLCLYLYHFGAPFIKDTMYLDSELKC